jgi:hypothetical protein|nr:MAG TPA: PORTAL PROTEIN [Caudoviricetes sp.]
MLTPKEIGILQKLYAEQQKQRETDKRNRDYYRGLQVVGNLGISIPPDVQPFAFPLNWCRTYVDALEERQDVRLIMRQGTVVEDTELRRDWDANNLDAESHKAQRDLLIYGRCFATVAADPNGGRPRIRVENPRCMSILVDQVTRETVAALRTYRSEKTKQVVLSTLYLPDQTILIGQVNGKWEDSLRIPHDLGRVPVVAAWNRQESGVWAGESQLTDLKPIVDMCGRVMLQLQLAMETVATPQKVALGVSSDDFRDEDGEPISDPWEMYMGAMLALSNSDAKVLQLPGASLDGFHSTIKMLAEQAATVTGLPVRMMGQNTANPAAEGAIKAEESRLVKQVERLNSTMGTFWAWVLGIAERIRTREWDSDGMISIGWHNPATPTESQRADAVSKYTAGKQTLSVRGALNSMGWSQARIEQELRWLDEEQLIWDEKLERSAEPAPGETLL